MNIKTIKSDLRRLKKQLGEADKEILKKTKD